MGNSIPSNWQSGVYKRDKRNPHFLFPCRMAPLYDLIAQAIPASAQASR